MIMAAEGLLRTNPRPTADDIEKALAGNICRCTGYVTIVKAVQAAAAAKDATQ
jgi:carbon-monoxide dehydrogenase small subunit